MHFLCCPGLGGYVLVGLHLTSVSLNMLAHLPKRLYFLSLVIFQLCCVPHSTTLHLLGEFIQCMSSLVFWDSPSWKSDSFS